MRHDPHHAHARNRSELIVDRIDFDRQEPQTIHAGIDLDVAADVLNLHAPQNFNLPGRVNDRFDLEALKRLDVAFIEKSLKKQNALLPAAFAGALSVAKINRRKTVSIGKGGNRVFQSVTVGICLDNSPDVSVTGAFANAGEVVSECIEINFSVNGARHDERFLLLNAWPFSNRVIVRPSRSPIDKAGATPSDESCAMRVLFVRGLLQLPASAQQQKKLSPLAQGRREHGLNARASFRRQKHPTNAFCRGEA